MCFAKCDAKRRSANCARRCKRRPRSPNPSRPHTLPHHCGCFGNMPGDEGGSECKSGHDARRECGDMSRQMGLEEKAQQQHAGVVAALR